MGLCLGKLFNTLSHRSVALRVETAVFAGLTSGKGFRFLAGFSREKGAAGEYPVR